MINVWNALTLKHKTVLNNTEKWSRCTNANLNLAAVADDDGLFLLEIGRKFGEEQRSDIREQCRAKGCPDGGVGVVGKYIATSEFCPIEEVWRGWAGRGCWRRLPPSGGCTKSASGNWMPESI
jgi:hypothetical protein